MVDRIVCSVTSLQDLIDGWLGSDLKTYVWLGNAPRKRGAALCYLHEIERKPLSSHRKLKDLEAEQVSTHSLLSFCHRFARVVVQMQKVESVYVLSGCACSDSFCCLLSIAKRKKSLIESSPLP